MPDPNQPTPVVANTYNATGYTAAQAPGASTAPTGAYQSYINNQLSTLATPVTADSATVRAQTDPYRLNAERGLATNQRSLAEGAYASGNANAGGTAEAQQSAREAVSAAEGTNTGNVIAGQEQARVGELENLTGTGQAGSLQQQGITNQLQQFNATGANEAGQFTAGAGNAAGQFNAAAGTGAQQFNVTSQQNQTAIENALKVAQAQNALGYYSTDVGNNGANYRSGLASATP